MLLKWLYISLGSLFILGGMVTFWLPLPLGVPLMLIGTPIVMRHSSMGRRWILRIARRFPRIEKKLRRWHRHTSNQPRDD